MHIKGLAFDKLLSFMMRGFRFTVYQRWRSGTYGGREKRLVQRSLLAVEAGV